MSADSLIARLQGVQGGGHRWRAICPSCRGSNASKLAVRELEDERVLLHCFGGCSVDDVLAALGLDMEVLFPPKTSNDLRRGERKPWRVSDVVAALRGELVVGAVILADVAAGKGHSDEDRRRASQAVERIGNFLNELSHAA